MPQPILADIGEVIGGLIGLIALVLWVIQKIAEASKAVVPPRPAPGAPPVRPAGQAGPQPAGQQADQLRAQVEEFMRRAAGGQQMEPVRNAPRPAQPPASEIEILLDEEAQRKRAPLSEPLRPIESRSAPPVGAKTPIQLPSGKPKPRRSSGQRKRRLQSEGASERFASRARSIAEQSSHLGERIVHEDQQFDVQLKAKFDHTVGTLAGSEAVSEPQSPPPARETPAAQIAAMLANPDGVRQAMILNEILRRPSW